MKIETAKFEDVKIGDTASISKTVTETDVILFAGLTGDFNPLHINEVFAKSTQFGRRLVHGAFSSGLISTVIGMKLPGAGALYLDQYCRFKKPVYIGDTLTATAAVSEKLLKKDGKMKILKIATTVSNQDEEVVTEGEATVMLM